MNIKTIAIVLISLASFGCAGSKTKIAEYPSMEYTYTKKGNDEYEHIKSKVDGPVVGRVGLGGSAFAGPRAFVVPEVYVLPGGAPASEGARYAERFPYGGVALAPSASRDAEYEARQKKIAKGMLEVIKNQEQRIEALEGK